MEKIIEKALSKGVEMHVAGSYELARQLYESVIELQPNHADANHNMGLLKLDTCHDLEALPYLQTALQADTSVAQFWLSYIKALIKLDRLDEAARVLDLAKESGIESVEFLDVNVEINALKNRSNTVKSVLATSKPEKIKKLDNLKLDQTLKLAKQQINNGALDEAKHTYYDTLLKFPKNSNAQQGLAVLKKPKKSIFDQKLPKKMMNNLINLYRDGHLSAAVEEAQIITQQYPDAIIVWNILGAAQKGLGRVAEASQAFKHVTQLNPNFADGHNNFGVTLKDQGKMEEAIKAYKKALSLKPDYADAHNNMGVALNDLGNVDEAVEAYNNAISIKPDYADAHNNKGNALKDQGKLDEATEAYNNAISIRPDYADAHNNKGNALKDQGKLDEATEAYNNAISIKPDYAEAYCNMGIALKEQGKLEEAVNAYNKALSLKLDFAEAYNNLGIALQDQEKLEAATEAYNKAISIRPDYADAQWNLSGTAESVSEAKQSLDKCLTADPNHLIAELTLSALKFYEGDKSDYNTLLKSSLKNHPYMRSFIWTFNLPKLPPLHFHRWALFDHMTALSKKDRPFYEFGVWRGEAFRYLIKTYKRGYGFDTFEGLPEDWHNEKSGTYSSDGNVPRIDGGEFIVGKFEDTLPGFFAKTRPTASIINFDADLYSSTICALNFAKPVIDQDTILIFDEFIINKHWEQDEYKALEEFCADNHFTYEVLAVSFFTKQVAVKIIGI